MKDSCVTINNINSMQDHQNSSQKHINLSSDNAECSSNEKQRKSTAAMARLTECGSNDQHPLQEFQVYFDFQNKNGSNNVGEQEIITSATATVCRHQKNKSSITSRVTKNGINGDRISPRSEVETRVGAPRYSHHQHQISSGANSSIIAGATTVLDGHKYPLADQQQLSPERFNELTNAYFNHTLGGAGFNVVPIKDFNFTNHQSSSKKLLLLGRHMSNSKEDLIKYNRQTHNESKNKTIQEKQQDLLTGSSQIQYYKNMKILIENQRKRSRISQGTSLGGAFTSNKHQQLHNNRQISNNTTSDHQAHLRGMLTATKAEINVFETRNSQTLESQGSTLKGNKHGSSSTKQKKKSNGEHGGWRNVTQRCPLLLLDTLAVMNNKGNTEGSVDLHQSPHQQCMGSVERDKTITIEDTNNFLNDQENQTHSLLNRTGGMFGNKRRSHTERLPQVILNNSLFQKMKHNKGLLLSKHQQNNSEQYEHEAIRNGQVAHQKQFIHRKKYHQAQETSKSSEFKDFNSIFQLKNQSKGFQLNGTHCQFFSTSGFSKENATKRSDVPYDIAVKGRHKSSMDPPLLNILHNASSGEGKASQNLQQLPANSDMLHIVYNNTLITPSSDQCAENSSQTAHQQIRGLAVTLQDSTATEEYEMRSVITSNHQGQPSSHYSHGRPFSQSHGPPKLFVYGSVPPISAGGVLGSSIRRIHLRSPHLLQQITNNIEGTQTLPYNSDQDVNQQPHPYTAFNKKNFSVVVHSGGNLQRIRKPTHPKEKRLSTQIQDHYSQQFDINNCLTVISQQKIQHRTNAHTTITQFDQQRNIGTGIAQQVPQHNATLQQPVLYQQDNRTPNINSMQANLDNTLHAPKKAIKDPTANHSRNNNSAVVTFGKNLKNTGKSCGENSSMSNYQKQQQQQQFQHVKPSPWSVTIEGGGGKETGGSFLRDSTTTNNQNDSILEAPIIQDIKNNTTTLQQPYVQQQLKFKRILPNFYKNQTTKYNIGNTQLFGLMTAKGGSSAFPHKNGVQLVERFNKRNTALVNFLKNKDPLSLMS